MTVAVHRRSGVRHLLDADGIATRCGRVLYRRSFRRAEGEADCRVCLSLAIPAGRSRADALRGVEVTR